MSRRKHRKKNHFKSTHMMELNVMPFVDIFSLLCTFLLFTAVFISIGMHTVQVPYFAASTGEIPPSDKPELNLKLTILPTMIKLEGSGGSLPTAGESYDYENTPQGLEKLYEKLVDLKKANPSEEKINVFTDDDLSYDRLIQVFDAIRISRNALAQSQDNSTNPKASYAHNLFPKVILGDVIP